MLWFKKGKKNTFTWNLPLAKKIIKSSSLNFFVYCLFHTAFSLIILCCDFLSFSRVIPALHYCCFFFKVHMLKKKSIVSIIVTCTGKRKRKTKKTHDKKKKRRKKNQITRLQEAKANCVTGPIPNNVFRKRSA